MQLERPPRLMWLSETSEVYENVFYQLEAVTKAQPLFLKQHLEAANGAVVTVQHEHGQGGELACAVPTVAAVHHH